MTRAAHVANGSTSTVNGKPIKGERVLVRCGHCDGGGLVPLGHAHMAALALVPKAPASISAYEVARRLRIAPTAAINRMTKLWQLRLIERAGSRGRPGYEWSRP